MYYFQSPTFRTYINSELTGIGGSLTRAQPKQIAKYPVPLPSVEKQNRIAGTLDKIQSVITLRKQQLEKLDELVKARFVEMFGDPFNNEKGFTLVLGSDIFKLSNGKFVPENKRFDSGIPVYGGNGISWYTDEILYENDTIVVGRVGFQSGNVHLVKGPLWISDNAMFISEMIDKGYDLQFLFALMGHIDFTRFQDAGDLKKITQKPFMQMMYYKPPLSLQKEYTVFVEQTYKSKFAVQSIIE